MRQASANRSGGLSTRMIFRPQIVRRMNLLSNAVKCNRDGGSVTITTQLVGERARVTIADTGPGLEEAELDLIFMPFEASGPRSRRSRAPASGSRSRSGSRSSCP